jgi:hypothetical protein
MNRIRRAAARLFHPPKAPARARPVAPLWVRGLTAGGRPIVLGVALLMCAPGEYHLARAAGWDDPFAFGMPIVLSAYAGIAAAVASTRHPGDRGRWSAIIGACLALGLAMAAQVVSHWIGTGHLDADRPALIAVTSLVPPAVVGHLLHLAATPPQDADEAPARVLPEPVAVTVERAPEVVIPPVPALESGTFWSATKASDLSTKMTASVPAETPRQVVTEVVTLTPAELRRRASKLNREVVTSTKRPVTIDRLREEFGLSRREAAELRREVVTTTLFTGEAGS